MNDTKDLMYSRGKRDGLAGLDMSSTSADYMKGHLEGRRIRIEKQLAGYSEGVDPDERTYRID
jgi:hypothetical protein